MRRNDYLYMLVTNDRFELPMSAPLNAVQIAERVGISERSVRFYSSNGYKKRIEERSQKRQREFRAMKPYKIIPLLVSDMEELENE